MKSNPEIVKVAVEKIGEAVDILISMRKIPIMELCKRAGISNQTLNKIRRGENYEMRQLIALLMVLDAHMDIMAKDADNNVFGPFEKN